MSDVIYGLLNMALLVIQSDMQLTDSSIYR